MVVNGSRRSITIREASLRPWCCCVVGLVWQAAVAAELDVAALASRELNGRQIKNALQLALALAQSEGTPLAQRHLNETLEITAAFVSHASGGEL